MEGSLNDKVLLMLLTLVFLVLQFIYQAWNKSQTNNVIKAIGESVKSFDPHVERGRKTLGILKDLKGMHDVRDDDGRPMWYMPREFIETQRELVSLMHSQTSNERAMLRMVEKMDIRAEVHRDTCKAQFNTVDKRFHEVIKKADGCGERNG